jgi:hypothetical protein
VIADGAVAQRKALLEAWADLSATLPSAWAAQLLAERRGNSIYRLQHVDGPRPSVIAKRSPPRAFALELTVYRDVLPSAGVRAPRLLGVAKPSSGPWLFLEEIRGVTLKRNDPDHTAALEELGW